MTSSGTLITVYDSSGRLLSMSDDFARHFGIDEPDLSALAPPFPWWPDSNREAFQSAFEMSISERGHLLEGVQVLANFKTADGSIAPFLVAIDKRLDGTTACIARPHDIERYEKLASRSIELARIAQCLVRGDSSSDLHFDLASLSPREETVVELLGSGNGVDEIADELNISIHTARNHRKSIFCKLGVKSHVQLMAILNSRGGLL